MKEYEIFYVDADGNKNVVGVSWLSGNLTTDQALKTMQELYWDHKYDGTEFSPVVGIVETSTEEYEDSLYEVFDGCLDLIESEEDTQAELIEVRTRRSAAVKAADKMTSSDTKMFLKLYEIEQTLLKKLKALQRSKVKALRGLMIQLGGKDLLAKKRHMTLAEFDTFHREFRHLSKEDFISEMEFRNLDYPTMKSGFGTK